LEDYMFSSRPWTQIPNEFVDEYMKVLTGSEIQVFLLICRKTIGWHKETDAISQSQMREITGMTAPSIITAIRRLEEKQLILVDRGTGRGHISCYTIALEGEEKGKKTLPFTDEKGKEILPITEIKGKKTLHTKERGERQKKNTLSASADSVPSSYQKTMGTWQGLFLEAVGEKPLINGITGKMIKGWLKAYPEQVVRAVLHSYFEDEWWFTKDKTYDVLAVQTHWNLILSKVRKAEQERKQQEANDREYQRQCADVERSILEDERRISDAEESVGEVGDVHAGEVFASVRGVPDERGSGDTGAGVAVGARDEGGGVLVLPEAVEVDHCEGSGEVRGRREGDGGLPVLRTGVQVLQTVHDGSGGEGDPGQEGSQKDRPRKASGLWALVDRGEVAGVGTVHELRGEDSGGRQT
jgi:phage replication O-like protein O